MRIDAQERTTDIQCLIFNNVLSTSSKGCAVFQSLLASMSPRCEMSLRKVRNLALVSGMKAIDRQQIDWHQLGPPGLQQCRGFLYMLSKVIFHHEFVVLQRLMQLDVLYYSKVFQDVANKGEISNINDVNALFKLLEEHLSLRTRILCFVIYVCSGKTRQNNIYKNR